MRLATTLLACILLAPLAGADVTVSSPVLVAALDNQHDEACMPVVDACLLTYTIEGFPGGWQVDAYQQIHYVGVAADLSLLKQHFGEAWLLPDGALGVQASTAYVEHPVFRIVTERWQNVSQPSDTYYLHMNETGMRFHSYNPAPVNPLGPWGHRYYGFSYGEDVNYTQFGPVNTPGGESTDHYAHGTLTTHCIWNRMDDCWGRSNELSRQYKEATPQVAYGLEFYDVEVATDPDNLTLNAPAASAPAKNASLPVVRMAAAEEAEEQDEVVVPFASPAEEDEEPRAAPRPTPSDPRPRQPQVELQGQTPRPPPPDRTAEIILGVAAATGLVMLILGAALYSRFANRKEALQSEARERLVAVINERPGLCLSELVDALGLSRTTVDHHLRVLERVQAVKVVQQGKFRTFYPVGAPIVLAPPSWLRRNETCVAILRALHESPVGLSREDVHKMFPEVPERTRNYHVARMLAVGALEQVQLDDGRQVLRVGSGAPAAAPGAGVV